ncbi:class C sortase [Leucobacter sp. CSA1]|uniref:Class C sortase n=2 Tax=Leucobacter chromiisoli TaxID=2796471 RepID=A0A934Q9A6_9MICO|nr:class C sortase [Leucobacter chromiisoli]
MAGLAILLYPAAANWFSARNHNNEIAGYTQGVADLPEAERQRELRLAEDYNARMPQGPLRDPYSSAPATETEESAAYASYERLLGVSDSGVIGSLSYPEVGITLPVYHGTSDEVISKGAGHLYGSSLPVGGPSTHSVLTAHSGLASAKLFTDLHRSETGQLFSVEVLGEKHYYRVDSIVTVRPEDTRSLRIVAGEDYVTLITCTPIGVNSHRLLVRGVRVPPPESGREQLRGDEVSAGFPWWALALVGGSAASGVVLFRPRRRGRTDVVPAA